MEANQKLDCINRVYTDGAIREAKELIQALEKFLANPADSNTSSIQFAYSGFMRYKIVADTMTAHRD